METEIISHTQFVNDNYRDFISNVLDQSHVKQIDVTDIINSIVMEFTQELPFEIEHVGKDLNIPVYHCGNCTIYFHDTIPDRYRYTFSSVCPTMKIYRSNENFLAIMFDPHAKTPSLFACGKVGKKEMLYQNSIFKTTFDIDDIVYIYNTFYLIDTDQHTNWYMTTDYVFHETHV